MHEYWVELADKELSGPFKELKLEIVRQSVPALLVCGAKPELRQDKPKFAKSVIDNTTYSLSTMIPLFILRVIIAAVVQWLIKRWLDRNF